MFDADSFLGASVEGELDTEFVPIPEAEYQALIEKVEARQAKSSTILDVTWIIDDPSLEEVTGREKNTVRQSVFLDLSASGGLDMGKGKNVQLGKLREALGQNKAGAWSPNELTGNVAVIQVKHRPYEGQIFADVKGVAAI